MRGVEYELREEVAGNGCWTSEEEREKRRLRHRRRGTRAEEAAEHKQRVVQTLLPHALFTQEEDMDSSHAYELYLIAFDFHKSTSPNQSGNR